MMKTYTYLKQTITKNEGVAGYTLPFSVYMNGQFYYADSFAGIKTIIWFATPFVYVAWPQFLSKNKISPCEQFVYIEGNGNRWKWHKIKNGSIFADGDWRKITYPVL